MDTDVQTFYSTVTNSMSNVMHTKFDFTGFKLPMCRNNLMSCSSSIPFVARPSCCQFFSYFIHVDDMSTAPFFIL
jgi:hypothetical protein